MHLDPLAHPVADGRVVDVHELETDLVRVGRLKSGDHVAQLHLVAVAEKRVGNLMLEVSLGKPELLETQPRIALGKLLQRIDVRLRVAQRPVVVNEAGHATIER